MSSKETLISTWNKTFSLLLEAKETWKVHRENWLENRNSIESLSGEEAQRLLSHNFNGSVFEDMLDRLLPYARVYYGGIEQMIIPVEEEKLKPKIVKTKGAKNGKA